MKNYVYLAGSITRHMESDNINRALSWRKDAVKMLIDSGIKCFDPCKNFEHNKYNTRKMFLQQNNIFLNKSNIMLVDIEKICESGGTLFEVAIAYNRGMQIISFGDIHKEFEQEIFGHYKEIIRGGIVFEKFDEAIHYLVTMFDQ